MAELLRVAALVSGGGSNLQAIIDAAAGSTIDAQVVCVGTDNPRAGGLKRAAGYGIPTFVVNYAAIINSYDPQTTPAALPADFHEEQILVRQRLLTRDLLPAQKRRFLYTRAIAEAMLLQHLSAFNPDLLVLAGFMRKLTPYFIDHFNTSPKLPRIMNIHPALLPAFPGVDGYGDTFRYGCKVGGCTVHFVDYGEDTGPIIGQRSFAIHPGDTLDDIKRRGLHQEWQLYPDCIQLYAHKRLSLGPANQVTASGATRPRTIVHIAAESE